MRGRERSGNRGGGAGGGGRKKKKIDFGVAGESPLGTYPDLTEKMWVKKSTQNTATSIRCSDKRFKTEVRLGDDTILTRRSEQKGSFQAELPSPASGG